MNSHWEEQYTCIKEHPKNAQNPKLTFNALLPGFQKRLQYIYLDHLKLFHALKTDSIHRNVIKNQAGKFMEKERDMDFKEAAEAAINKTKFLLDKMFKQKKTHEEPSAVDVRDYH